MTERNKRGVVLLNRRELITGVAATGFAGFAAARAWAQFAPDPALAAQSTRSGGYAVDARQVFDTIVIGAGKASAAMARALEDHWDGPLEGLVITRYGHGLPLKRIRVVEAGHPVPDESGETAAREIAGQVKALGPDDLLLALGPLVAIAVLISGFALGNQDPSFAAQGLNRIISFIAPQVAQYDQAADPSAGTAAAATPEMVQLLNNFISNSRSGAAGLIGILTLFLIVIGLFTTIENTFNDIWGVRRGRSLLARIVYYWSVITLGAVVFFASLTLLSAGAAFSIFFDGAVHVIAQQHAFF